MTLRRLKIAAIALPILGVIALELARYAMVGLVSWEKRLALDLVYVAGIFLFAAVIFRVVEEMQEQLQRQNQELLALHSASLDVSGELSLEVVLKKVVEQARNLVGAHYGALSVIDRENRILSFITAGITPEERAAIGPPPVGHGLLGVVLRHGQHLRLQDITHHPQSHGFPQASHARVDVRRNGYDLVTTIADDGLGFSAAARSRSQFPQFGLSTMRERAESIGGTLVIDSTPGEGTTVRFTLPLPDAEA
jgi:hypothetical protein